MLGKALLSLLLVLGAACAAFADDPPIGPPAVPPGEEGTWYGEQLALRLNPAEHVDELLARFGGLDGQVLVEQTIGEDHWLIFWSAALGHVQIAKNGEFMAMTLSYDHYGRAAFDCDGLTGWVDVADEYVQGELSPVGQPPLRYVGLYPEGEEPPGAPGAPLCQGPTRPTECVCKGSLKKCPRIDCVDRQPCSFTNAAGATIGANCIWARVPVGAKEAPPAQPAPPSPPSAVSVPAESRPDASQPQPSGADAYAPGSGAAGP